tara:strand:+ start:825 stop:2066 length:1242 start_codon:yes stop_codon:yes gene_type:complete
MSTKNNKPLVLAPQPETPQDVQSNIHEALEQTGIIYTPEALEEAAPGFGVLNDVLASPEKHDKDVVAAASIGSTFNPIAALQSVGSAIKDAPGTAFMGIGKILTQTLNSYDKEELQEMIPENVLFLMNDLFADGANMPTYTEEDAPASVLDAASHAYFNSQKRQRGEGSSAKWRDNKYSGLVYGDYGYGNLTSSEEKFSNRDYLLSKLLGSAQVIENEDGSVTVKDTFDFNDSKWAEAGLTRLHYDKDGNVTSNAEGGTYGEGERKLNIYGGKPVSEMTNTEKLFSAWDEISALGGIRDISSNIYPAMRTLAFYFGSKDDSGRPISLTFNPHEAIARAPVQNWYDDAGGDMYYDNTPYGEGEEEAYKKWITDPETRGRVWGSGTVNSVKSHQRNQNYSLINKANKALSMFKGK